MKTYPTQQVAYARFSAKSRGHVMPIYKWKRDPRTSHVSANCSVCGHYVAVGDNGAFGPALSNPCVARS